jgi:hypothetical protein
MTNNVRVEPPKPSWWENSSIKRAIDVASGRVPTASQVPKTPPYGINYLTSQLGGLQEGALKGAFNAGDAVTRFISGRPGAPIGKGFGDLMYDPVAAQSALGAGSGNLNLDVNNLSGGGTYTGQRDYPQPGSQYYVPGAEQADKDALAQLVAQKAAEEEAANQPAPTDWLAEAIAYQNQFAPDYSSISQGWMDEGNLVNQRLQAMYDQIASRAGENVQRVSDIYSGASEGIGSVYDTASANTEQAYASAQQQAADQMARLGIEAAAPAVLNPAALSQAEAVANLESGRASGLGATERYGASSGDFASQMAQVAQQEGAQYQTSVTDALRRQMMNLEMRQQQDAYQRAMQAPGLAQQLQSVSQLNQEQGLTPEQQLAYERFAFEQGQAGADIALGQEQARNARYQELYALLGDKAEEQLNYEISIGRI